MIGESGAEDADAVADATNGAGTDRGVIGETSRVFQAEQARVLGDPGIAGGMNGPHESNFFSDGE